MAGKKLDAYLQQTQNLLLQKPDDAAIPGQTAVVDFEGTVIVNFSSASIPDVTALRDWLTTLLE